MMATKTPKPKATLFQPSGVYNSAPVNPVAPASSTWRAPASVKVAPVAAAPKAVAVAAPAPNTLTTTEQSGDGSGYASILRKNRLRSGSTIFAGEGGYKPRYVAGANGTARPRRLGEIRVGGALQLG